MYENTFTVVQADSSLWYVIVTTPDTVARIGARGVTDIAMSLEHALEIASGRAISHRYTMPTIIIPLPTSEDRPRTYTNRYGHVLSKSQQVSIKLSDRAWEYFQLHTDKLGYRGRGRGHGASAYVLALLRSNPSLRDELAPDDSLAQYWRDTRPDWMREFDKERAASTKLPIWSDTPTASGGSDIRTTRLFNATLIPEIEQRLTPLAKYFLISPMRGSGVLSERALAHAALEAIGCQYLTPINEAVPCSNPKLPLASRHKPFTLTF